MKFVQNNKILEDSNAEIAEISAEKGKNKFDTSGASLSAAPCLRVTVHPRHVFSALSLRSLRLCVELTTSLTRPPEPLWPC